MNMKQAAELLSQEGISTILKPNVLQEEPRPYESYYQLKKSEEKWLYGLFMVERQNNPYLKVRKEFNTEEEGAKYFFIDRLSSHYFLKNIQEFISQHPEVDIYSDTFDEEELQRAMSLLSIPLYYLAIEETKGKNKAIRLDKKDDNYTVISFLNDEGECVNSTLPIENESLLFFAFKTIYKLYLFEKRLSPLLELHHLRDEFTDDDIVLFF
ncbi:hypothetical protein P6709_09995 [Jeotgalibacillus sp. ET6]|uniref:hypothetical protein n=1 Tax=Jeotgalibacillus sp. ET6 TaxID=3037260 RepID=UPI0024186C0C|nr:hypothetical protein [Jeotgalibacillus sp. ET6]MDG5472083.1 hypothetical protein [Jeotgalibacillus sp. ET6]